MRERDTLKPFMRRVLKTIDDKGTEFYQIEAGSVIAQLSRIDGELQDLVSGRRDQKRHKHHPIELLKRARTKGVLTTLDILSECLRNNQA